jgi:hypothetical protein
MFHLSIFKRRSKKATSRSRHGRQRPVSRGVERLEPRLSLTGLSILPAQGAPPAEVFSTVPANGDANPYGVSVVPANFPRGGVLNPGDILATNFNSAAEGQGTGTTIVQITPSNPQATPATFFSSTLPGVTTPPVILKSGLVVVGNVPLGAEGGIGPGALQILDKNGNVVTTLTSSQYLPDPWYVTANDQGNFVQLFVSNVSGTTGNNGFVTRIDMLVFGGQPIVLDMRVIASGYPTRLDPAAFVLGPGGLAFNARTDTLYVASEDQSVNGTETGSVYAVRNAALTFVNGGMGKLVYADLVHLHGPMGLVLAPNGDLVTANADGVNVDPNQPSELVEFTTTGRFVDQFSVDPANGGAFALAFGTVDGSMSLLAVDDNTSTLDVWTVQKSTVAPSAAFAVLNIPSGVTTTKAAAIDAALAALFLDYASSH